ncbi:24398_t:CDS:2 [Gigaspora margarita]|uniref:24398_t:CDS:1 n=1 Tax=Gigaspora margarita TaxID=4874 RepID=A0ABN7UYM8_GIGMA|nr:24398_t:CDS:2 [Gigaspora margarita]
MGLRSVLIPKKVSANIELEKILETDSIVLKYRYKLYIEDNLTMEIREYSMPKKVLATKELEMDRVAD